MAANSDAKVPLHLTEWVDHDQLQTQTICASTSDRVVLKPGIDVRVGERLYRISQILDLETVLAHDPHSGETSRFKVGELAPPITLAMDIFSRMVVGFYVSFDPPGAMAVGLCLAHAILPKESCWPHTRL